MKTYFFILIGLVFLNVGIAAVDSKGGTTNIQLYASVNTDYNLSFFPNPLVFKAMYPGESDIKNGSIRAGFSNIVIVGISVYPITGSVFNDKNLLFSLNNRSFYRGSSFNNISFIANESKMMFYKLNIPEFASKADYSGKIVYTVMEG